MAKHCWGAYDTVGDYLFERTFSSRKEAREYCEGDYALKVVKLVIQPEKKKEKVKYYFYNKFYYKIENNKVYTYYEDDKRWGVIPSITTPEWVRENMTKVSIDVIKTITGKE
mgnify:CR=1 FL=1